MKRRYLHAVDPPVGPAGGRRRGAQRVRALGHHRPLRRRPRARCGSPRGASTPPSTDVSVAEVQARYGLPRRWFVYPPSPGPTRTTPCWCGRSPRSRHASTTSTLVLTGGEGPAEQHVRDQIAGMGLRDRVRRTGLIPRRDVLAVVRGAVAMTCPSRYEGFGLPVLEAMSVGTPVLSSDAGVAARGRGRCRLDCCPSTTPTPGSRAWCRLLDDGEERARLVDAGRARVAGFTWRHTADCVLDAYRAMATLGSTATLGVDRQPRVDRHRTGRPSRRRRGRGGGRAVRLLVLCPHFAPDTAPTGEVMTSIATELVARGHELHVVTSLPVVPAPPRRAGLGGQGRPPRGHRLGPHHPRPPVPHRQAQHPGPGGRRSPGSPCCRPRSAWPAGPAPAPTPCWRCRRR